MTVREHLFGNNNDNALPIGGVNDALPWESGADVLLCRSGNDRRTGGNEADRFMFEHDSQDNVITDFEEGVDAIEFLIDAFGFDDLDLLDKASEATITNSDGTLRLFDVNAAKLDASDFGFTPSPRPGSGLPTA